MTVYESNTGEQLNASIEGYIAERREWLSEAAEVISGSSETPVEAVLTLPMENPGEARRDSPDVVLDAEQEAKLREIAGRFGIGGEGDVSLDTVGLPTGHVRINEGGLVWKMVAEEKLSSDSGTFVYAASPYEVTKQTERDFEVGKLGMSVDAVSQTQYEAAEAIARSHPDFTALEKPRVLPFGYDIQNQFSLVHAETGQFVQIGTRNDKPVIMLRVDREYYQDEHDEKKYRKQPDTANLTGFVADVLTACGDDATAVGVVTSNTYASRAIGVVRAGLNRGRQFGVAMYGRQTLADAKQETATEPTELNQIPTELGVMREQLGYLEDTLTKAKSSVFELDFSFEPLGDDIGARMARIEVLLAAVIPLAREKITGGASGIQQFEDVLNGFRLTERRLNIFDDFNENQ